MGSSLLDLKMLSARKHIEQPMTSMTSMSKTTAESASRLIAKRLSYFKILWSVKFIKGVSIYLLTTFNYQPMFKQVIIFLIILESIVSSLPDNCLTLIIIYYEII